MSEAERPADLGARQLTDNDDLVQNAGLQTLKRMDHFEPRGAGLPGKPDADAARTASEPASIRLAEEMSVARE